MTVLRDLNEVVGDYDGLSRKVLDFTLLMKRLVDSAKEPGFSAESWAPLAEVVAIDELVRVGPFKEVMDWEEYVGFLTGWATSSKWECSFKRVTETPGLVFLELEERSEVGDYNSVVNSVSVYEFNEAGKISFMAIYLQMALPEPEMLKGYEGVEITE